MSLLIVTALVEFAQARAARAQTGFPNLVVSVGYADNLRANGFFPTPWSGSSGVIFEGCTASCTFDSGAAMVYNASGTAVTVNSVTIQFDAPGDTTSCIYDIWPHTVTLPAGDSLIVAQTASGATAGCTPSQGVMDSSDIGPNSSNWSGNCSQSGVIPQVTVTANNVSETVADSSQVLNTGGIDLASCPGGSNESEPWTEIFPNPGVTSSSLYGGINLSSKTLKGCSTGGSSGHVDPINCATGDFFENYDELSVPGRGVPLNFSLSYNSLAASQNSSVGFGWTDSYDALLSKDQSTGNVTIAQENGSTVVFTLSNGQYAAPGWAPGTLTANSDGTWTYTRTLDHHVFLFSSTGQLMSVTDRNGYATSLSYNSSGQLTTVTDPEARSLSFSYGTNGLVSQVTDPAGRTVNLSYDTSNELTSITDPAQRLTTFGYDSAHHALTVTDGRSNTYTNVYDSIGRVSSQTDPLHETTTFGYVAGTTTITDTHGNVTEEHFANDEPVAITKGSGTSTASTWHYSYDPTTLGLAKATDPNNDSTTYTYDSDGNVTSTKDALNNTTTASYNSFDEPLSNTDATGITTSYAYDANGNLLSNTVTGAGGSPVETTTYTYGDTHLGEVTQVTDPAGHVANYTYDAYGDLSTTTTHPSSSSSNTTADVYDVLGRKVCEVSPNATASGISCPAAGQPRVTGTTTYTYDSDSEVTSVTDALGNTTSYRYDADGNQIQTIDPAGKATTTSYDADNRESNTSQGVASTSIGAGWNHSLAIRSDATLWDWGYNSNGQLGNGTTTSSSIPVEASGLSGVTAATGGLDFSLALRSDGTVWAWGNNNNGQLGNGTTASSTTSVEVSGLSGVTAIAAGGDGHSLALRSDGTVWAWGSNYDGQLGNGTTASSTTPVEVSGLSGVTSIAAGGDSSANGFSLALRADGTVWAWGYNYYGQLGNGTTTNSSTPVEVSGLSGVSAVAAGGDFSLALRSDGTAWTWGYGGDGELGNGTVGPNFCNTLPCAETPVEVSGLSGVTAVAAGTAHGLALRSDGTVWAWGYNYDGQLGNGTTTSSLTPVEVSGINGVAVIAAGNSHSLALRPDGTVWAWGGNYAGQLGNGSTNGPQTCGGTEPCSTTPVASDMSGVAAPSTTTYAYDLKPISSPTTSNECSTAIAAATYCNSTTNSVGNVTVDYFDAQDRQVAASLDAGTPQIQTTTDTYDAAGNVVSQQTPSGFVINAYDVDNRVTSASYSNPATGFSAAPNVSYAYNADGERTQMIDGTGTSRYTYDTLARLSSVTNGASSAVSYGYDSDNNVTTLGYPNGQSVTRAYDGAGELQSVTDWLGKTTTFSYDHDGNLTNEALPNGVTSASGFNSDDQVTSISDTGPHSSTLATMTYNRNADGQVGSESDIGLPTPSAQTYSYDQVSRLSGDSTGPYVYDTTQDPLLLSNSQSQSRSTSQQFNVASQLTSSIAPDIYPVATGAAEDGSLAASSLTASFSASAAKDDQILVAVSENATTSASVSGYTQVGAWSSGSGDKVELWRRTAAGGETSVTVSVNDTDHVKAIAVVVYRGVDPVNPVDTSAGTTHSSSLGVSNITVPSVTATQAGEKVVLAEGALGNVNSGSWSAQSLTQEKQETETDISAALADATQQAAGPTVSPTASLAGVNTATSMAAALVTLRPAATTYGYDALGDRNAIVAPNGAATTLGYNQVGELISAPGATYAYNGDGLRATKTTGGQTANFTWDISGSQPLLLSDGTMNYVYGASGTPFEQIANAHIKQVGSGKGQDPTGTASSVGFSIPSASPDDQILVGVSEDAGESATISGYSQVGSWTTGSGDKLQIFSRTATGGENSVTVSFSPSTDTHQKGAVAVVYRGVDPADPIDASGGNATSSSGSVTAPSITTTGAGDQLVMFQGSLNGTSGNWSPPSTMSEDTQENQLLSAAGVSDTALSSPGATGSQTASYSGTSGNLAAGMVALNPRKPLYYLQDQLGSVRMVTDHNGKAVASYTYTSYGQTTGETGDVTVLSTNPFGFAGAYTDAESGYLYLVNRFYDPATAQFLSVDPLVGTTGQAYSYAADSPMNATDPLGLYVYGYCASGSGGLFGMFGASGTVCATETDKGYTGLSVSLTGTAGPPSATLADLLTAIEGGLFGLNATLSSLGYSGTGVCQLAGTWNLGTLTVKAATFSLLEQPSHDLVGVMEGIGVGVSKLASPVSFGPINFTAYRFGKVGQNQYANAINTLIQGLGGENELTKLAVNQASVGFPIDVQTPLFHF